jgi:ribosome-binding ATPase YchF (GTP1/OBG family)
MISEIELGEEKEEIKEYQFLTAKPSFCVLNINGKTNFQEPAFPNLKMNLKEEEDFLEFSDEERKELGFKSKIDQLIKECYKILNLVTFYTIAGGKEAKAWTIKEGTFAPQAGGIVHSDFEKKFIKAEVLNWNDLVKAGSWQKAKEVGLIKIVGRDYIIKDGDIIEFRI